MRILFFGDSITQGFWSSEGGWVEIIRRHYDHKALENLIDHKQPAVFNVGISGDTTTNLLARIEGETKARIWPNDPIIVVIAIGTNDNLFESGEQWVEPKEFQANLQQIINKVIGLAKHVVLIGNPACDESLTTPVPWDDMNYTNKEMQRSEATIAEVAKENNLTYIPMYDDFKQALDEGKSLLADGLHPNDEGHKFIASKVLPVIDELVKG